MEFFAWGWSGVDVGERVQGYTDLLMTLLMSVATLIFDKSTAALAIQILGVGLMLATGYASMEIADHVLGEEANQPHMKQIRILALLFALS